MVTFLVGNQREHILLNLRYTDFWIKLSVYRMGVKFDKDPLAVEQNNYLSNIVSVYIEYDLDPWPKNSTNNFKFRNYFIGASRVVKRQ